MFEPKFTEFKKKVSDSFDQQIVMKTIKATLVKCEPGLIEIDFPYQKEFTQQHGFIHAGIVSTILDSACGYASYSLMPEEAEVLSVDFKTNLLSPAKGEIFKGIGRVIKPGRNITFAEAELFAFENGQKKLVATMTATIMAIYQHD